MNRSQNKQQQKRKEPKSRSARSVRKLPPAYPLYSAISGMPMTRSVTLPYHMEMMSSTSGGFSTQTFRTIDMHDPDYTGGGHQCRGWDQYKVFYRYYRVTHVLVKARYSWEETPSQCHSVGMYVDDDSTFDYSNTNDLYEKTGPRLARLLTPDRTSVVNITTNVPIDRYTRGALKNIRTLCTASPTETGPYVHIWAVPNNTGVLSYGAVRIHIELQYTVDLHEPLAISGS